MTPQNTEMVILACLMTVPRVTLHLFPDPKWPVFIPGVEVSPHTVHQPNLQPPTQKA